MCSFFEKQRAVIALGVFMLAVGGATGCDDDGPVDQEPVCTDPLGCEGGEPTCDDPDGCDGPEPSCDDPDGCDDPEPCEDELICNYDPWATDNLWDENIVPIPCTGGELCYDRNNPIVQARVPAYRDWMLDVQDVESDDYSEDERERIRAFVDAAIEATHRMLESCNYFRDETGAVRVDCPEEVRELAVCPQNWFLPEMTVAGILPDRNGGPAYCLEDAALEEGKVCATVGCDEGLLCSGSLSLSAPREDLFVGAIYACIERSLCLELREELGAPAEDSCLQWNREPATAPTLESQDCGLLEDGLCAVNCPCALPEQQCQLLTENQPVGLCTTSYCSSNSECSDGESCVVNWSINFDHFWLDYTSGGSLAALHDGWVASKGVCAPEDRCERAKSLSPHGSDFHHYNFNCHYQ